MSNAPIDLGSQTLTVGSDNTSTTFSGSLSGGGGLTKVGLGTLILGGNNTYSGGTTSTPACSRQEIIPRLGASTAALAVNGGTLDVHGYNLNAGPLTAEWNHRQSVPEAGL